MNDLSLPVVQLNKGAEKRLRAGHRWIYSNEIDNTAFSIKQLPVGSCATVRDSAGKAQGSAYFNTSTLLCGRLYSLQADVPFETVIRERIVAALQWRQRAYVDPYYRLCYGDGDALPGVVVDRYGDLLVLQLTTAGAMSILDTLIDVLVDQLKPSGIVLRNDAANVNEGLDAQTQVVYGKVDPVAELTESGVQFDFPVLEGQKTGWFYDHRDSRMQLKTMVSGARVLDLYSYVGGWGLQALAAGAESAHFVDRSALALDFVARNAKKQGVGSAVTTSKANVDDALKAMIAEGEQYDVVIVDPPAFIKKRKDQRRGEQAYHRINQQAVRLLSDQGILVSASCSLHLEAQRLQDIVRLAAVKRGKQAQFVYQGGLGADHPVLAAIPEMNYLKATMAVVGKTS